MSQEVQLGKYEFYPCEFDNSTTLTLEELKDLLRKARADNKKAVNSRSKRVAKRGSSRK